MAKQDGMVDDALVAMHQFSEDRKPAKPPKALPTPGDVKPLFTFVSFELMNGSHITVGMDPEVSTKLLQDWIASERENKGFVFHFNCPDAPYNEFLLSKNRIAFIRLLDEAHAFPAICMEEELARKQTMAEAAQIANYDITKMIAQAKGIDSAGSRIVRAGPQLVR